LKVEKTVENLTLSGESNKLKDGSIVIEGTLKGDVEVECIKCLKKFNRHVDENVKFKVVKPPYNGFDEDYDIIEQEKYDLEDIIKSEIESVKNDYNICESCQKEDFDKEF
jgi:uncharacterized metal-binding protein YceD (DUF177 family)